jgi:hypothetical protein
LEAEDQDGKKIDPIEREFPEKEFWAQKEDAARTLCISMGDNFDYLRNRYARTMKATITVIYQDVADNVYRMNKELEYEI